MKSIILVTCSFLAIILAGCSKKEGLPTPATSNGKVVTYSNLRVAVKGNDIIVETKATNKSARTESIYTHALTITRNASNITALKVGADQTIVFSRIYVTPSEAIAAAGSCPCLPVIEKFLSMVENDNTSLQEIINGLIDILDCIVANNGCIGGALTTDEINQLRDQLEKLKEDQEEEQDEF